MARKNEKKNDKMLKCGMKKPLYDDIMTMCVKSFQTYANEMNLADQTLFSAYFAGFMTGTTGIMLLYPYYKTCKESKCDYDCDNCDVAKLMRVHFLAKALRQEFDNAIKEEMKDEDISKKIL